MTKVLTSLKLPVLISSIVVLPLMLLELINRRGLDEGFPIVLFGTLWLLALVFTLVLMPIIRQVRAGSTLTANPFRLLLSVVVLLVIAGLWVGIVRDQMPCFLGVLNCD